jgi:hypothetical protein
MVEFDGVFGLLSSANADAVLAAYREVSSPLRPALDAGADEGGVLQAASRVGAAMASAVRDLIPLCRGPNAPEPARIQEVVRQLVGLDGVLKAAAVAARGEAPATASPFVEQPDRSTRPRQDTASGRVAGKSKPGGGVRAQPARPETAMLDVQGRKTSPVAEAASAASGGQVTLTFGADEGDQESIPSQAVTKPVTLPISLQALEMQRTGAYARKHIDTELGDPTRRAEVLAKVGDAYVRLDEATGGRDPLIRGRLEALATRLRSEITPSGAEYLGILTDFVRDVAGPAAWRLQDTGALGPALEDALDELGQVARRNLMRGGA